MRIATVGSRLAPVGLRLTLAFVELALACAVIVGAVIGGHNLREWRDWYPTAYHPWLDGPRAVEEPGR